MTNSGITPAYGPRLVQLDALRGLAAAVVVIHHVRDMLTVSNPSVLLVPFFAGGKSVILFFVLSGYVLALPYWRNSQLPYGRYLVRRFCRIYLPYLGALVFAVLAGRRLLYAQLPLTHWFYATWHTPFTPRLIIRQALLVPGRREGAAINLAFWSLKFEMEMSILFPAICWIVRALPVFGAFAFAAGMEIIGIGRFPWLMPNMPTEVQDAILWASAFMFGALLSKERSRFIAWYNRLNQPCRYLFLYVVVMGYFRGSVTELSNIPAACGVIVLAECCRARFWLAFPIAEYLGKISYSLYLIHGTVLFATLILLYGKIPTSLVVAIYLIAAFAISHLFCIWIELPTMKLGKILTKKRGPAIAVVEERVPALSTAYSLQS